MKLSRRDQARLDGYCSVIKHTQSKPVSIKWLSSKLKSMSVPTVTKYCLHLVDKGYLKKVKPEDGMYKTVYYQATVTEYDVSKYEPMVLFNGWGEIHAKEYEVKVEEFKPHNKNLRVISFEDVDLRDKYQQHTRATRTKGHVTNDGYREACC
jgi:hypothetical protein